MRRLAIAVLLVLAPPALAASLERIEAVGVAPAREAALPGVPPRQAALQAGVAEAVRSAALRLAAEAGSLAEPEEVVAALGDDPFEYAVRFRLIEDRGERRRLLLEDPEVEWEYVVLLEVHVDLDRVRERLAEAGVLAPEPSRGPLRPLRLSVEGLASYSGYAALRGVLASQAAGLRPLEFAPGRAVLEVDFDGGPEELLERLLDSLPEGLSITPIEVDGEELRIRIAEPAPAPRSSRERGRVRALYGGADLGPPPAGVSPGPPAD